MVKTGIICNETAELSEKYKTNCSEFDDDKGNIKPSNRIDFMSDENKKHEECK
jgi:hypothetical protein